MEASRPVIAREATKLGVVLSEQQLDRLVLFVDLAEVWNRRIRLIGDRDPGQVALKHIPDCLALVGFLPEEGPLVDIGTGAGLPGLVLACVRPDLEIHLIESRRRRASFLSEAKAKLELGKISVFEGRAEDAARSTDLLGRTRTVTARAVSLETVVSLAELMLIRDGRILAMQSKSLTDAEARRFCLRFGFDLFTSRDYSLAGGEGRRILEFGRV